MFQVGQVVEVKSLEELHIDAIYDVQTGRFSDPDNPAAPLFIQSMYDCCGAQFTITDVERCCGTYKYSGHNFMWSFTDFMLKPARFDRSTWKPKPGDVVRIREWDDMVAEFGVDDDGEIPCELTFIEEMKEYCGLTYTIKYVDDDDNIRVWFEDDSDGIGNYSITKDMIEPVRIVFEDDIKESDREYDQSAICSFFGDLLIV